jgi:hypothetical protein
MREKKVMKPNLPSLRSPKRVSGLISKIGERSAYQMLQNASLFFIIGTLNIESPCSSDSEGKESKEKRALDEAISMLVSRA